jgi:transcriptional regulator NrdR family protein
VFTTTESADLASGLRIKLSNNKLQPFCHAKLLISIYKCCKHLNNPELTAQALANTTISKIITQNNTAIITATNLKSTVYNVLARYDKASSVQYAALHQLKYK